MAQLDTYETPRPGQDERPEPRPVRWPIPVAALGYVVGAFLVVLAYRQAQTSNGTEHFTIFWLGMALVLAVTVLCGLKLPEFGWSLPLVLLALGLFTFLPKLFMSPSEPVYYDEFAHLRHAEDVLRSGDIGASNDLLPVIQYYPGLSLLTAGVHFVTGLNAWHSGQIVIIVAHCATLLLVFALARKIGAGPRVAFAAALVYAANPGFMYFDSQYAYESLAIAFVLATAVCTAAARTAASVRRARLYTVLGLLAAIATIFTHHISAGVMALLCLLLAATLPSSRPSEAAGTESRVEPALRRARRAGAWVIATFAVTGVGVWNLGISTNTRGYLLPSLTTGIDQLIQRVTGSAPPTSPGQGSAIPSAHTPFSGSGVPFYETPLAYAEPVLVFLAVLYLAWRLRRSPNRRFEIRRATPFVLFSLAYLASLPLALTVAGNQAAHRSWPFFFIGVAQLPVWLLARREPARRERPRVRAAGTTVAVATLALLVLTIGSVSSGASVVYRFPGPYQFGRDNRFQTHELDHLVNWADAHLSPSSTVLTDRFTSQPLIIGSRLRIPTNAESYAYTLYNDPDHPSINLRRYLAAHHFGYFIFDTRIADRLPQQALFQTYAGFTVQQYRALQHITDNGFITLIHRTDHYRVYRIHP